MKVLVVGGGGREHALAWKLAQSDAVEAVLVAPGNAGTAAEPKVENVALGVEDIDALAELADRRAVDFTVVGPEGPLVAGVVDEFAARGLRCLGPTAAAARLEGSKAFAKSFLTRHGIPTAAFEVFSEFDAARRYIEQHDAPLVVKADGLAAGKGVTVAATVEEAVEAARQCLVEGRFGAAGGRVVVEEFLDGEEVSFICLVDGQDVLALATSQDHKARDDGDRGPNTGGMGAYSPAPIVSDALHARIVREVIEPTVNGLARDGVGYTGFLYAGLMIAESGDPKVLEFNCRCGDPETQPVLMRVESDLAEICESALSGTLHQCRVQWDSRAALGVVMAAGGYPGRYRTGDPIEGLERFDDDGVKVFHAGTRLSDGGVVTSGGRVLCVTALGENVSAAQKRAYAAVEQITWRDAYHRSDIGWRAVAREQASWS